MNIYDCKENNIFLRRHEVQMGLVHASIAASVPEIAKAVLSHEAV
jgi:hypothetical protein